MCLHKALDPKLVKAIEHDEHDEHDVAPQLRELDVVPQAAPDLPEQDRLDALPVGGRLFMDAVRMTAYRAQTRMMAPVISAQGKNPNARRLLRALLTSAANIIPEPTEAAAGPRQRRLRPHARCPLTKELNATRTIYPGTELRLVYELVGDPLPDVSPDSGSGQEVRSYPHIHRQFRPLPRAPSPFSAASAAFLLNCWVRPLLSCEGGESRPPVGLDSYVRHAASTVRFLGEATRRPSGPVPIRGMAIISPAEPHPPHRCRPSR